MQAPRILSAGQRDSLESTFTCLKGIASFVESIENKLPPDEKLIAGNVRDLAGVCERKLITAWPEILPWLADWTNGGV
jgi:hypothetical protein